MINIKRTHLFLVMVFAAVVDAVLIVIKLYLKPGYEHPMKDHTAVNIISSDRRRATQTDS